MNNRFLLITYPQFKIVMCVYFNLQDSIEETFQMLLPYMVIWYDYETDKSILFASFFPLSCTLINKTKYFVLWQFE